MSEKSEKLIADLTVRVQHTTKQRLMALAEQQGLDGYGELVRNLIDSYLAKREAEYSALHSIFGKEK